MNENMAYIALCRNCNGKVWMSMDGFRDRDANAEEMPGLVKKGYIINRVGVESANDTEWCKMEECDERMDFS